MEDGQHRTVANRIKKFVDMPCSGQRTSFRFSVTDHGGNDEVWIVESCAASVGKHVSQLAAFMDRAWSFGRAVTANAAGKRKLFEDLVHATFVFALFRVDLGVSPLKICGAQHPRRAMPGPSHKNHVQIKFFDQSVQMEINESEAGARSPVPK